MFGYRGYNKRRAFTLAEVLITLGIIGTVAAMTIPTLMMNYQRNVWEAKLKKVYGIATNGCERMLVEENVSSVNETSVYESISDDTLKKYFKLMKEGKEVSGKGYSMQLPDSAVLYISTTDDGFKFITDVNGTETRPNMAGKDLFEFSLDKDCSYVTDIGNSATNEAKCFKATAENDWKIPNSCGSAANGG